ncbi:hypothetical protein AHAS_Ahas04G0038000 [Arachis hypogaea]
MTEKEMNFKTCKQVIMGMWDNPEGVAVDEVDINRMLFSFKDKRRGLQVLRGGPWCIKGFLLNLKLWSNSKTIHEVKHDHMEFWVQAHGVSLEHLNRDVAKLIRNEMENLIEVEDAKVNNVIVRSFLRMTVAVNVIKLLPTRFWLDREELPQVWIHFKYERLLECYYLNCGRISHRRKECKEERAMAIWNLKAPKHLPGMGVIQAKPISFSGGRDDDEYGREKSGA